jgi:hypothetical protein
MFSFVGKPFNFRVTLPGIARAHGLKLKAKIEEVGSDHLSMGLNSRGIPVYVSASVSPRPGNRRHGRASSGSDKYTLSTIDGTHFGPERRAQLHQDCERKLCSDRSMLSDLLVS